MTYEGYGPGGVAIMVDCLTDNKKRTAPEIRTIVAKNGGNLGESGCVSYLFTRKGMIIIESGQAREEEVLERVLDYGVEDVKSEEGSIVVTTTAESYQEVLDVVTEKKWKLALSEITFVPQTTIPLDGKKAEQCLRLIELLEEQDDVQQVYSNYDIPNEIIARYGEGK